MGDAADLGALKRRLLDWYRATGARASRDLPWRRTRDPYAIWVSETMLQQTRAATVIPYWERFVRELPTVQSLAEAPEERVLALWSGLGYYRRARMLHAAAAQVVRSHGGRLPEAPAALLGLRGVGAYTAGALASIAFGARVAAVDGNVERVLARLFAIQDDVKSGAGKARVCALADDLASIDEGDPGDWSQALMELGAMVCTPGEPRCRECPLRGQCAAFAGGIAPDLPRKAAKRARPAIVRSVAVVLASRGAVLLARRRPDAGLFAGLWEAPQRVVRGKTDTRAARALAARLGVDAGALRPAGEVVHVLSHREMRVRVLRGELGPERRSVEAPGPEYVALERVPFAELRAAHTRPYGSLTRKVLDMANVPWRGLR